MKTFNVTRDQASTVALGGAVGGIVSPTLVSVGIGIIFATLLVFFLEKIG